MSDIDTEVSDDVAPTFPTIEDMQQNMLEGESQDEADEDEEDEDEEDEDADEDADADADEEEDEEEEVFDIDLNGTTYYTTDDKNGKIYNKGWPNAGDNEEIGDVVGSFKNGEVNFF
jgi:hypothetical protein